MIAGRSVLAVVPARGGSKGLPRKNVLQLGGVPLIAWTLRAAMASRHVDRCIVSSDDDEIMDTARRFGAEVPFRRPAELAGDATTTPEVIRHVLETLPGYDIVVVLQPTNPLRTSGDIDLALERMQAAQAPGVVSVTEPDKSPFWSYTLDARGVMVPLLGAENATRRRQELPKVVTLNGVLWAVDTARFLDTGLLVDPSSIAYEMPAERSLDIDTARDLRLAEFMLGEIARPARARGETLPGEVHA